MNNKQIKKALDILDNNHAVYDCDMKMVLVEGSNVYSSTIDKLIEAKYRVYYCMTGTLNIYK